MYIDQTNIHELALGCALLGSGGGGDITYDLEPAVKALDRFGPVSLCTLDSLPKESLICPIGFMGAPIDPTGDTAGAKELERLLQAVQEYNGQKIGALIPLEIGGGNGLTPLAHAGRLQLPVLDADLIGRAFPQLHMTSAALAGRQPGEAFLADAQGNLVHVQGVDAHHTERLLRAVTKSSGQVTALCTYIMRAHEAKEALILGSYSKALELGRALKQGEIPGQKIASGLICEVKKEVTGGFVIGFAKLDSGVFVYFQNEYFFVTKSDGDLIAQTPDIIALIDTNNHEPLSVERLQPGFEVEIFCIEAPPIWKSAQGLLIAGKDAFKHLYQPTSEESQQVAALP